MWDLGGDKSHISMLPLVCVDAVAILFMFDLSQRSTLSSVREWYRQVRAPNQADTRRPSPRLGTGIAAALRRCAR